MVQSSKKITEKRLKWYGHVRRMKEEHIVRRMLDVDIPGKRRRGRPKPTMERCMQERHDRSGSEKGQHNKQGRIEEGANQLYRRPQMTGQAREDEEQTMCGSDSLTVNEQLMSMEAPASMTLGVVQWY